MIQLLSKAIAAMISINPLYGAARATVRAVSGYTLPMKKFGFRIQTHAGMTVDNLMIQGIDQAQAEAKLRQMYHRCTILECKVVDDLPRGDGTDLEGAISLIVGHDKR